MFCYSGVVRLQFIKLVRWYPPYCNKEPWSEISAIWMLQLTNAAVSTSLLQPVQGVCVFSTFSRSFYPSTPAHPVSVLIPDATTSCSRGVRHVWSRNCDTEMLPPGTCYIIQDICADAHRSVKAIPRLMCENGIVTCWMQKICLRLEAEVSKYCSSIRKRFACSFTGEGGCTNSTSTS